MKTQGMLLAWLLSPLAMAAEGQQGVESEELSGVQARIVGGAPAVQSDWGFFTQIVGRNDNVPFCGASYLGEGYVLTAAHCLYGLQAQQLAVKAAGFYYDGHDGVRANVAKMTLHPDFDPVTFANDIAVLKLDRVLKGVEAVELADGSLSHYAVTGDKLKVAGLGHTVHKGKPSAVLHEVQVPLVDLASCRAAGGGYSAIGNDAFCAGLHQGGKDACQGDSGGPIVVERGGAATQLGIVSWGIGCALPGKYGVYANIAHLRAWLDQQTGQSGSHNGSQHYALDYQAQQDLGTFSLGEIKAHTFTIRNSGQQPFTLSEMQLSASGSAVNPLIGRDECSYTRLSAQQQCQVTVEFSASATGSAGVVLQFGTDQVTTRYTATANATVTSAGAPGGQVQAYDFVYPEGMKSYKAGTKVLGQDGAVYQCKGYPFGLWCAQGLQFAPGSWGGQQAWNRL